MSKMQSMLRAALEETTTEEIIGEDITMNDDIVVVEEINTAETELRMTEEAIDVLEETEESLEEITAKMEEAIENDEASEETVMFLNMALNVTMRNAGADSVVAGVESFGDHKAALQAGIEAAEESKQGVLAAIKKFVAEMWEKLVTWFKSIFTAVGRMKKGAQALLKTDIKGKPSEKEVDIGKKVTKLMIGGTVSKNLAKDMRDLVDATKTVTDTNTYLSATKKWSDGMLQAMAVGLGAEYTPEELDALEKRGLSESTLIFEHFGLKRTADGEADPSDEILGQVQWKAGTKSKYWNPAFVVLSPVEGAKEGKDIKLEAMDASEIKTILKLIVDLAVELESIEKNSAALKQFSKEYSAKYDALMSKVRAVKEKKFQRSAMFWLISRGLRKMILNTHKASSQMTSHSFSVLSAAYAYALASKKNLKEA